MVHPILKLLSSKWGKSGLYFGGNSSYIRRYQKIIYPDLNFLIPIFSSSSVLQCQGGKECSPWLLQIQLLVEVANDQSLFHENRMQVLPLKVALVALVHQSHKQWAWLTTALLDPTLRYAVIINPPVSSTSSCVNNPIHFCACLEAYFQCGAKI